MQEREKLSSRLGFILVSAGCAIGLGNVWRFPFVVGQYGGAIFVLIYFVFLLIFGIPILSMEFAVGRASKKSVALAFHELEPKGTKWHLFSKPAMIGNYLLMMFYTTVVGWVLAYTVYMFQGRFVGMDPDAVEAVFGGLAGSPSGSTLWMVITCVIGFGVCAIGLQKGVEKITKFMMSSLFIMLLIMVVRTVTLPGAGEGLAFFLMPSLEPIREHGIFIILYSAMSQAFFTLSLGMGSMLIFGSYINREQRLLGESINITIIDTVVAILSGLMIFPACAAFGISVGAGPSLLFITLPNVFNSMPGSVFWGILFFVFMSFATITTVFAVFENIIAFAMDATGCSRKKACIVNFFIITLGSLPVSLGLGAFGPFGDFIDLWDFIVSNNILPLGSLIFLLFCVSRRGWGWENFLAEVDAGKGRSFPAQMKPYFKYVLPVMLLVVYVFGMIQFFS